MMTPYITYLDDDALDAIEQQGSEKDYWVAHWDPTELVLVGTFDATYYINLEVRFKNPWYVAMPAYLRRHVTIVRPSLAEYELFRQQQDSGANSPFIHTKPAPDACERHFLLRQWHGYGAESWKNVGLIGAESLEIRAFQGPHWQEWSEGAARKWRTVPIWEMDLSADDCARLPEADLLDLVRLSSREKPEGVLALEELRRREHPWVKLLGEWLLVRNLSEENQRAVKQVFERLDQAEDF